MLVLRGLFGLLGGGDLGVGEYLQNENCPNAVRMYAPFVFYKK